MKTKINKILFLLLITCATIEGARPFSRRLQQNINLEFISAKNLIFDDSESRWKFDITYAERDTAPNTQLKYTTSILFNSNPGLASCSPESDVLLKCYVTGAFQTNSDLVQINKEQNDAQIKWVSGLSENYNIPINADLSYIDSYSLKIDSTSNIWEFRVKIMDEDILPENGFIKIDLVYTDKDKTIADCNHKEHYLYCSFTLKKPNKYILQISQDKYEGSVHWMNLKENKTIPISASMKGFKETELDGLELIDGQWNYRMQCWIDGTIGNSSTLITINSKIIKSDNTELYYLTRCYSTTTATGSSTYYNYKCTVFGGNQELSDLVLVSTSETYDKENDISIDWNNILKSDHVIVRAADLTFKKIYDISHTSSKFKFGIEIENDNLPDRSTIYIDVAKISSGNSYSNKKATCSFSKEDKTLTCESDFNYLQSEKVSGSVTWTNLRQKYIDIPLNVELTYQSSLGGLFTDKWNFIINVNIANTVPANSTFILDVLQNNQETTATCKILGTNTNQNMLCILDSESQESTDTVLINPSKVSGTVTWKSGLETDDNQNKIVEITTEETEETTLTFVQANHLYYSKNKWHFSFMTWLNKVGKYKVDIVVKKSGGQTVESTATCLSYYLSSDNLNGRFICTCDYANQDKEDLIKIAHQKRTTDPASNSIKWQDGDDKEDYPIALDVSLTFIKSDLEGNNFAITLENNDNKILPVGSQVIVDISTTAKTAICNVGTKTLISCSTSGTSQPNLVYYKSLVSSVTWENENKEDYYMLSKISSLYLYSANYLYYESGKWKFNIKAGGLNYGKTKMEVLYDGNPVTAVCIGKQNYQINCELDLDSQEQNKLVKLRKEQSADSYVTKWSNLNQDIDIPLRTELTFDKVENLHVDTDGQTWVFDLYIKDEGIPENAFIITDIDLTRYYGGGGRYFTKADMKTIANCYHKSKVLECKVFIDKIEYKAYEYGVKLIKTKNPSSTSTVTKWNGIDDNIETLPISLSANLQIRYVNQIETNNGKNTLYIELSRNTRIPKDSIGTIDILIDSTPKIADCKAVNHTTLQCDINEDISDKKVYIPETASSSSTIKFSNLLENQNAFQIQLDYIHVYNFEEMDGRTYNFRIIVSGNDLKDNLLLPVKVYHHAYGLSNDPFDERYKQIIIENAACKSDKSVLYCSWYSESAAIRPRYDIEYLLLTSEGDTIKWSNPGHYDLLLAPGENKEHYSLTLEDILLSGYDKNKYYKFAFQILQIISMDDLGKTIIIDFVINGVNKYGLCKIIKPKILECQTEVMNKAESDVIKLKRINNIGNTEFRTVDKDTDLMTKEEMQIYPLNYPTADVSNIYDLQFITNKWQFKIFTKNMLTLSGNNYIYIKLNGEVQDSGAICTLSGDKNDLLTCEFTAEKEKLITINSEYEKKEDYIRLYNLKLYGIPLVATLEFVSISDLAYNDDKSDWSFTLKTKYTNGDDIPFGSTVSIDIDININEITQKELAFCTESARNEGDKILTLNCVPQNDVSKESLISLSTVKSTYASVTWSNSESMDTTVYSNFDLTVDYVEKPVFDSSWKFNIIVEEEEIAKGSKAKLDIKYNNQDAIAICEYKGENKFECVPQVNNQKNDDTFSISTSKKSGTITFKNTNAGDLAFVYTLIYDSINNINHASNKWTFQIKLTGSDLNNNEDIDIGITIDDDSSNAKCKLYSNVLNCEVESEISKKIKIIKNKGNGVYAWVNFPEDDITLYLSLKIGFIFSNGGFYDEKWHFYIHYNNVDNVDYKNAKVSLDIVENNNKQAFAECEVKDNSYLICTYESKASLITISGNTQPTLGTVSFDQALTDNQKKISPASFSLNYNSKQNDIKENILSFVLEGKLGEAIAYDLLENSFTQVQIIYKNNNNDRALVPCLTNEIKKEKDSDIKLTCKTEVEYQNVNIDLYTDSEHASGSIKINNDNINLFDSTQKPDVDESSYLKNIKLYLVFMLILL